MTITAVGQKVRIGFVPSMRFPFSAAWCGEMRRRTLTALSGFRGLELVTPGDDVTPGGLIQNDDQASAAIAYLREEGVDAVMIGAMDFGDEISAATVAAALGKPVLLFGTKEGEKQPNGERVSDSFCGVLSISTALRRRKVSFVWGGIVWPEEEEFQSIVRDFVSAVSAAKAYLGARVGQIGVRPERFETVAYNEPALLTKFGQKVIPIEVSQVVQMAKDIDADDPELAETIRSITGAATRINVNDMFLDHSGRFELALKRFAGQRALSAMAVQCWPALSPLYGIAACSTFGRLTDQGIPTACEVDVMGALDMLTQFNLTRKEYVPHFIDWTIQHRRRENVFLAWHCGNGPTSLRAEGSDVVLRNRGRMLDVPVPADETGAGVWEFTVKPGPVTFTRTVEYDGEFKMLIVEGEVVEDPETEKGSSSWVQVPDLERMFSTLIEEGFIHHASMLHGRWTRALGWFAQFVGVKTVVV